MQDVTQAGMAGLLAPAGCGNKRLPAVWVDDAARAHVVALVRLLAPEDAAAAARVAAPDNTQPQQRPPLARADGKVWRDSVAALTLFRSRPFLLVVLCMPARQCQCSASDLTWMMHIQAYHVCFDPDDVAGGGLPSQRELAPLVLSAAPRSTAWLYGLAGALPSALIRAAARFNEHCAR